jgi:hypothetical protein
VAGAGQADNAGGSLNSLAGSVAYRRIAVIMVSWLIGWPSAIIARRSRKYCTYGSGVKVLSRTVVSSVGLAKECGAPGGIITNVPAVAS